MTPPARRHPNVVNISEVPPMNDTKGTRIGFTARRIGQATGARQTACNHFEVAPGRSAFPKHYHYGTEESIYILEGKGTMHIASDTVEVGPGDYVTFPHGPESAHQLVNSGDGPLRYLCFSNHASVEMLILAQSEKMCLTVYGQPGTPPVIRTCLPKEAGVDYFEGEDIG